jgi:predicted hydrocarbon binding protein
VHGVVFVSFRDFLASRYGADVAANLMSTEPVYLLSESYDDERLFGLVEKTALSTGDDADGIVFDFGAFTAEKTFARLYRAFYEIAGSARTFLLTTEDRIHELVRATIPNAAPPKLSVEARDDGAVSIVYCSPRRLCVLLRGLVQGTARWYGEHAVIEETACMRRGDRVCRLEVRLVTDGAPNVSAHARRRRDA